MFKPDLKQAINERLVQFLQQEIGNRVTDNNMAGLVFSLSPIFEKHLVEPKKEEPPGD